MCCFLIAPSTKCRQTQFLLPIAVRNRLLFAPALRCGDHLLTSLPWKSVYTSTTDYRCWILVVYLCCDGIFGWLPANEQEIADHIPHISFYFVVSWMIISHS
uniref:Secreted protein n=1 Tax=Heterorhabditis bacteriophora TaxID=37862 RepID=A0A1I7W8Y9_HETBA